MPLTAASRSRWCRSPAGKRPIGRVYAKPDTGRWVEDSGIVVRLLPDGADGSRHQRFVLQTAGRQTLLIANNLDVGERVPVGLGDRVRFRGLYEWNDLGGLVHWTHRDPMGTNDSGWIRHRRQVYS